MAHGLRSWDSWLSSTGSIVVTRGIFLDQESNRCLLGGKWVLYHQATKEAPALTTFITATQHWWSLTWLSSPTESRQLGKLILLWIWMLRREWPRYSKNLTSWFPWSATWQVWLQIILQMQKTQSPKFWEFFFLIIILIIFRILV